METELAEKLWTLDRAASTPALAHGRDVTLEFSADDRISGRGPCNNYMGGVEHGPGSITVGNVATTMMACEPDVLNAESVFHEALRAVDTVELTADNRTLTLKGPEGVELVFHGSERAADTVNRGPRG